MQITTLVCACALAVLASEAGFSSGAGAQDAISGMGVGGPPTETRPDAGALPAAEQDPAERSAKAIECAQKADAQGLQGKIRKRFLHKCKSSV